MYSAQNSNDTIHSVNKIEKFGLSKTTNMADNVDWAALAQQWIQMKESCTEPPTFPEAPPPPSISSSYEEKGEPITYEEKGEAPMECEDDHDGQDDGCDAPNNAFRSQHDWQQSSWYTDQPHYIGPGWNPWTTSGTIPIIQTDLPPPALASTDLYKETAARLRTAPEINATNNMVLSIDAAKRKSLPAWIREGLEKMEKEKQKQMKKETTGEDNLIDTSATDPIKKEESPPPNIVCQAKTTFLNNATLYPENSDDSDGDDDDDDGDDAVKRRKTTVSDLRTTSPIKNTPTKTREEWLEEWMLIVRRSLTEILLEVTNEEILLIAQETYKKSKAKASSAQVFRKSAISSITGKLGLGAYADSASDNSESEDDNNKDGEDECDSEEEIKESLKIRQSAFKAIAQDIELRVSEAEQREQQKRNAERSLESLEPTRKVYEKDFGETQPDKTKNKSNGKQARERTSRFSDAKDSKYRTNTYILQTTTTVPSSSSSSSEFDKRKASFTTSKRSSYSSDSSSNSYDSYKRSKRRSSRDRSYGHSNSSSRRGRNRNSSDSDDQHRKRHTSSRSRDRSRSRSRSQSRSHTGRRYDHQRYK